MQQTMNQVQGVSHCSSRARWRCVSRPDNILTVLVAEKLDSYVYVILVVYRPQVAVVSGHYIELAVTTRYLTRSDECPEVIFGLDSQRNAILFAVPLELCDSALKSYMM